MIKIKSRCLALLRFGYYGVLEVSPKYRSCIQLAARTSSSHLILLAATSITKFDYPPDFREIHGVAVGSAANMKLRTSSFTA